MKVEQTENGVKLIPESDWDKQCLKKLMARPVKLTWEDEWDRSGAVIAKQEPDWSGPGGR